MAALRYEAAAMVAGIDLAPHAWDNGFAEVSRPCLRHTDLEVEIVIVDEDEETWFAGGASEQALHTIALANDDAYIPEDHSLRRPVLIGAGVVALTALAASAIFLL